MASQPDMSTCATPQLVASNYVVTSGTATCDDQDIWDEARRLIARDRTPDGADDYPERWKTDPLVLITVTLERIVTRVPRRRYVCESLTPSPGA